MGLFSKCNYPKSKNCKVFDDRPERTCDGTKPTIVRVPHFRDLSLGNLESTARNGLLVRIKFLTDIHESSVERIRLLAEEVKTKESWLRAKSDYVQSQDQEILLLKLRIREVTAHRDALLKRKKK